MRKTGSILVALLLLFGLTACGRSGKRTGERKRAEGRWSDNIGACPHLPGNPRCRSRKRRLRTVDLELYETPDFSIQIPKGWTVTSGGTGMYHSIRIQDPAEPLNQMFVLLKGGYPAPQSGGERTPGPIIPA